MLAIVSVSFAAKILTVTVTVTANVTVILVRMEFSKMTETHFNLIKI